MGDSVTGLQDGGYRISLADVVRIGYGQGNTVLLGDTDHQAHSQIYGAVTSPDVMAVAAEQGVSNMFLELPTYRQGLVDEFQAQVRAGSPIVDGPGFSYRFQHEDDYQANVSEWVFSQPAQTQNFLNNSVTPLLMQATRFGMDVNLLDPDNGEFEKAMRNGARRDLIETREEMMRLRESGDVSSPAVAARLDQLRTQYNEQREIYEAQQRAFLAARNNDLPQAERVNEVANGGRNLILYGAAHGSRHSDFEEGFDGGAVKIDLALNREQYEQEYAAQLARYNGLGLDFGEDPADLVYFIEEGVVATTSATSPELLQALGSSPTLEVRHLPVQERDFRLGSPIEI